MRYWWVNHKQTIRHEVEGGFLWSPKRKANDHLNPYYEFMREVSPGDLVLSFAATVIRYFGIARSHAYEAPKPEAFGAAGDRWSDIGWRVDVAFHELRTQFRPKDWMPRLAPLLPNKYSPLRRNGNGLQNIYLAELDQPLALALAELIGQGLPELVRAAPVRDEVLASPASLPSETASWEQHLLQTIESNAALTVTDKRDLVLARRGQGTFRSRVQRVEKRCRITHVDRPEHLRASHCKPWRDASNEERLSGENGLLLTPSIDHLFDRGFISFHDDGRLLVSPVADRPSLVRMGVAVDRTVDVGSFTSGQRRFLEYHRDRVFLESRSKLRKAE